MDGRNRAKIVLTKSGKRGRVYDREPKMKDKVIVWLEDENCVPVKDEQGRQIKLLVKPEEVKTIGFVD